MMRLNAKQIRTNMLRDESGTATLNLVGIGMGIVLLLVMTRLEGLIYCCTGGGFLLP